MTIDRPLAQAQLVNALFNACRALENLLEGLRLSAHLGEVSEERVFFSIGMVQEEALGELRYYTATLVSPDGVSWGLELQRVGVPEKDEFDALLESSLTGEVSSGLGEFFSQNVRHPVVYDRASSSLPS